jgi:outer membrane protein assembly factor BamB
MRPILTALLAAGLVAAGHAQTARDWNQWRGPSRDGSLPAFTEPKVWPEQLEKVWQVDVGSGYATPLLVGDRLYVFARQQDEEVMSALDAKTGKQIWSKGYRATFKMNSAAASHGPGPKSTPVFADGRLFAIGMTGVVTAYDAKTGKVLWQKPGSDLLPLYTSHAFSPLVERGLVFFHVGGHDKGALTAFDVRTGDVKWTWDGDGPGYGSPMILDYGGTRQLVLVSQRKAIGVDPTTGTLLWERPFVINNHTNSLTPVIIDNVVIIGGNTHPTTAFTVTKQGNQWTTEPLWMNEDTMMRMTNGLIVDGMFVSMSIKNSGQYFGLDARSGKTLWTSPPRQGANASMLKSGNLLAVLEDDGELLFVRASKAGFEPLKKYKVAESDTWTQPVLAGNRIFVKDVSILTLWTLK